MASYNIKYNSGDKYNKLTLTGKAYRTKSSRLFVETICECGTISFKKYGDLSCGHTKSCGCKKKRHGCSGENIYSTWNSMKSRCYQKSHESFATYGAKGILVCDEWKNDFVPFMNWAIKNGWKKGLTIDRIKNEKGYYPENCRIATVPQQNRNKCDNINITAFGETKCLQDWVHDSRCAIKSWHGLYNRIFRLKMEVHEAITHMDMNVNRGDRSNTIVVKYNNQNKPLSEWCDIVNLPYKVVRNRLYKGWLVERALETGQLKFKV